jgi:hypothetical protein
MVKDKNNPYLNGYINRELLHALNKLTYDNGLIAYDVYLKVKADIERL